MEKHTIRKREHSHPEGESKAPKKPPKMLRPIEIDISDTLTSLYGIEAIVIGKKALQKPK
jgi:hypothetical protein